MSDIMDDLGLNLDGAAEGTQEAPVEVAQEAAPAKARAPRVEIEVGEIVVSTEFETLAPLVRGGGATGSKYKFDELGAPVQQADGSYGYQTFTVEVGENDEDALKRSVQSATTQANSKYKAEGRRFVTRSVVAGGKFTAMKVYRVDGTLKGE